MFFITFLVLSFLSLTAGQTIEGQTEPGEDYPPNVFHLTESANSLETFFLVASCSAKFLKENSLRQCDDQLTLPCFARPESSDNSESEDEQYLDCSDPLCLVIMWDADRLKEECTSLAGENLETFPTTTKEWFTYFGTYAQLDLVSFFLFFSK